MMRVITLCGSTKFKRQFEQVNAYLTLKGNIVLSLAFFEQSEGIELTTEQAELLGDLHLKKLICPMKSLSLMSKVILGAAQKKKLSMLKEPGRRFGITQRRIFLKNRWGRVHINNENKIFPFSFSRRPPYGGFSIIQNRFIVLKYSSKQSNKDAKEGDHEYAPEPMP